MKSNKSPGYDNISYNVIKIFFDSLCEHLKYLFNLSIEKGVFPDNLNIAQVTPIYMGEDSSDVINNRPTFVLSCISKIVDSTMYNDFLYSKQFGFQNGHWTDHAVVQLVDQVVKSFENNKYTLSVLIDLSNVFDTVDKTFFSKNWNNMV